MRIKEYAAHKLIGSPFEGGAKTLRSLKKWPKRIKHPELREIYIEPERADLAIKHLVAESTNCIDIGAHLGSVLNLLTDLAPNGKHFAIEPIPYKHKWLRQKFPDVSVFPVALSDAEGETNFYVHSNRSGFSGLKLRDFEERAEQNIEILRVKLAKLDELIPDDLAIGFIKIDVEGAELLALKGAERILNSYHPPILFECFPESLKAFDITEMEVYDFFETHGYSIFLIKDWLSGGEPLSYEKFIKGMEYPFQAFNYLAIAHEDCARTT